MGTVASFNKNNILNPLSEYDFELLKTRSGITYKDPTLSLSSLQILQNRELEQKNSNLISHTQFLKKTKINHQKSVYINAKFHKKILILLI